jgi:hypothetical protein
MNGNDPLPRDERSSPDPSVESRLARLETTSAMLVEQVRELRDQVIKIRTTDFRILVGLIITSDLAIFAAIVKLIPA